MRKSPSPCLPPQRSRQGIRQRCRRTAVTHQRNRARPPRLFSNWPDGGTPALCLQSICPSQTSAHGFCQTLPFHKNPSSSSPSTQPCDGSLACRHYQQHEETCLGMQKAAQTNHPAPSSCSWKSAQMCRHAAHPAGAFRSHREKDVSPLINRKQCDHPNPRHGDLPKSDSWSRA